MSELPITACSVPLLCCYFVNTSLFLFYFWVCGYLGMACQHSSCSLLMTLKNINMKFPSHLHGFLVSLFPKQLKCPVVFHSQNGVIFSCVYLLLSRLLYVRTQRTSDVDESPSLCRGISGTVNSANSCIQSWVKSLPEKSEIKLNIQACLEYNTMELGNFVIMKPNPFTLLR